MKKIIFIFFLFFGFANISFSQDIKVNAVLDSSKIRIGEQVNLHLYVNYDANQGKVNINWPTIGDTITGKIEVISVSQIDTTIPDKNQPNFLQYHQKIIVSAYDSGYFAVPGFKFVLNNDTNKIQYTPTLLLEVHTVPTDTSYTKVKQIKPIYDEAFNWKWYINYLYWAIGLFIFILIIVLITRYYVKKNQNTFVPPPKPKIPAHITALASLETIKQAQAWKDGQIKEYYSSITDTIRLYLEERFGVYALESTTDEIMLAMRSQVIDITSKEKLQQLLQFSDLVKFAKMSAIESEHLLMLQNSFDFVNGTKREEELTPEIQNEISKQEAEKKNNINNNQNFDPTVFDLRSNQTLSNKSVNSNEKSIIKKIIIALCGAVVFVAMYLGVQKIFQPKSKEDVLIETMNSVNKMCPFNVDSETRLDNCNIPTENTLQYNYTLINISPNQIKVEGLKDALKPGIINQLKNNPLLFLFKKHEYNINYSYKDKTGNILCVIEVKPEDYK